MAKKLDKRLVRVTRDKKIVIRFSIDSIGSNRNLLELILVLNDLSVVKVDPDSTLDSILVIEV